jgi:hypothetical protein
MALTLAEAAKLSETDLQRGVIETFVLESVILDRIPQLTIEGNAYAYNSELALPGTAFRAVNTGYTESTGTVVQASETLVILGGDADVDTFIQKTRGDLNDQRAVQDKLKIKSAVYTYQDAFINGDNGANPEEFDGLVNRLTGGQVIAAGANGLAIVGADDDARNDFLDRVDELLSLVAGGADAMYMNKKARVRMIASARRLGYWTRDKDEFGRQVDSYNGVPMLDIGQTPASVDILPWTETEGTSDVTSSIYAVHFTEDEAEAGVAGLTNGGIQVRDLGEIDSDPVFRTRIEYFCGLATFGKGAARLTGVLDG